MKKLVLVLCLLLALTGCSSISGSKNITGLLSSPKRSVTESEVAQVLGSYLGENITLRYSRAQGFPSPIQLIDIDGDSVQEALVFYHAPNKGTNIRFALLSYDNERWNIVFDKEGLGSDVFYFRTASLPYIEGEQIIVGYLQNSIEENFFATYFTDPAMETADYTEPCSDIAMGDVTDDGFEEIILTSRLNNGRLKIKILTFTKDGVFEQIAAKTIRLDNAQLLQLGISATADGTTAVYMDYTDNKNTIYTEAGTLSNNTLTNCLAQNVVTRSWKYDKKLLSCDIDGDGVMEIPVVSQDAQHTQDTPSRVVTVQWQDFSAAEPATKSVGIYDTEEALFMGIPAGWQDTVYTRYNALGWEVVDRESEDILVSVTKIEANTQVENSAYSYKMRFGINTWHVRFGSGIPMEDIRYITQNTTVFD